VFLHGGGVFTASLAGESTTGSVFLPDTGDMFWSLFPEGLDFKSGVPFALGFLSFVLPIRVSESQTQKFVKRKGSKLVRLQCNPVQNLSNYFRKEIVCYN
jgi:hypothetical protein